MTEINTLGWIDYLITVVILCINAGIGIYYGKRQKTMEVIIIVK